MSTQNNSLQKTTFLEYSLTVKHILTATILCLVFTSFVWVLHKQTSQIEQLLINLESLQNCYKTLESEVVELRHLLDQKDSELLNLCDSISTMSSSPVSPQLDPEIIKAYNEQTRFYIKIMLGILGATTVCGVGFWLFKGITPWMSLKYLVPTKVLNFAQNYGFFHDPNTLNKMHEGYLWTLKLLEEGKDFQVLVKTPGSGESVDAMDLFARLNSHLTVRIPTPLIPSSTTIERIASMTDNVPLEQITTLSTTVATNPTITTAADISALLPNI